MLLAPLLSSGQPGPRTGTASSPSPDATIGPGAARRCDSACRAVCRARNKEAERWVSWGCPQRRGQPPSVWCATRKQRRRNQPAAPQCGTRACGPHGYSESSDPGPKAQATTRRRRDTRDGDRVGSASCEFTVLRVAVWLGDGGRRAGEARDGGPTTTEVCAVCFQALRSMDAAAVAAGLCISGVCPGGWFTFKPGAGGAVQVQASGGVGDGQCAAREKTDSTQRGAAVTRRHGLGPRGCTAQARAWHGLREGAALLPAWTLSGPSPEHGTHLRAARVLWLAASMRCAGALPAARPCVQAAGQCAPHVPPPQPPQCRAAAHVRRRRHVVRADGAAAVGHTSASDVSSSDNGNGSDSPGSRASHAWSASTLAIHGGTLQALRGSVCDTVGGAVRLGCLTETTRVPDALPSAPALPPLCPGERGGRPNTSDSLTTPIVQTSTYTFRDTAELIAFQARGYMSSPEHRHRADTLCASCTCRKGHTRALSTGATGTPPPGRRRTSSGAAALCAQRGL